MKICKTVFTLALLLFLVSCNEQETNLSLKNESAIADLRSQEINSQIIAIDNYIHLIKNYKRNYASVNPRYVFNDEYSLKIIDHLEEFKKNNTDKTNIEIIEELRSQNRLSANTADLLRFVNTTVEGKTDEEIKVLNLKGQLIAQYGASPIVISPVEDLQFYLAYNFILGIYEDFFSSEQASLHGCGFADFIRTIAIYAGYGGSVGSVFPEGTEFAGLPITIAGNILGSVVGTIVGIFTFNDDCSNCNPVSNISVSPNDNCGFSRTFTALGGGSDAGGYIWDITQNGSTLGFITPDNTIDVTQESATSPIEIVVSTLCQNLEDGNPPFMGTYDLNIIDATNPLGQAGEVSILHECPQEGNTGGPSYVGCNTAYEEHIFYFNSSNEFSGNIVFEYTITPTTLSHTATLVDEHTLSVYFYDEGSYQVSITATNICSEDQSTTVNYILINN